MKAHIDYEKQHIVGKTGKIYRIMPEMLSTARAPEYEIQGALLGFNTNFESIYKTIIEVKEVLLRGKDNAQGNTYVAVQKLDQIIEGLYRFQDSKRPQVIELLSLICIADGEDVGIHSEQQIREKYEEWAEIPIVDFIVLASRLIPGFKEYYKEALNR